MNIINNILVSVGLTTILLLVVMVYVLLNKDCPDKENFNGPMIFSEEGYGEKGNYIGNNRVEPIINKKKPRTIFDQ